ncbi:MAG: hypothetical protein LAP87_30980 [Acidobacteriia bacterium]|nr:hypothetical protein [Terriglobia bacterium]
MQAAPPLGPPMAGAPRKTNPIVWVLIIVLGLFVLGGIGIVGMGMFVVHKARQAGLDTRMIQRNPAYAVAKMMLAATPDMEEISHDDGAGTITVRDKKTGKVSTFNFEDIKNGRLKFSAEGENGEKATMEFGAGAAKLPSWVPEYPGSKAAGTFSVKGDSGDGSGEGGNVTFTTPDAASKVLTFYQDKAKDRGMRVSLTSTSDEGGMVIASDDESKRTLTVVVGRGADGTTINLTYAAKR